jgi:hypothetical protein
MNSFRIPVRRYGYKPSAFALKEVKSIFLDYNLKVVCSQVGCLLKNWQQVHSTSSVFLPHFATCLVISRVVTLAFFVPHLLNKSPECHHFFPSACLQWSPYL